MKWNRSRRILKNPECLYGDSDWMFIQVIGEGNGWIHHRFLRINSDIHNTSFINSIFFRWWDLNREVNVNGSCWMHEPAVGESHSSINWLFAIVTVDAESNSAAFSANLHPAPTVPTVNNHRNSCGFFFFFFLFFFLVNGLIAP